MRSQVARSQVAKSQLRQGQAHLICLTQPELGCACFWRTQDPYEALSLAARPECAKPIDVGLVNNRVSAGCPPSPMASPFTPAPRPPCPPSSTLTRMVAPCGDCMRWNSPCLCVLAPAVSGVCMHILICVYAKGLVYARTCRACWHVPILYPLAPQSAALHVPPTSRRPCCRSSPLYRPAVCSYIRLSDLHEHRHGGRLGRRGQAHQQRHQEGARARCILADRCAVEAAPPQLFWCAAQAVCGLLMGALLSCSARVPGGS